MLVAYGRYAATCSARPATSSTSAKDSIVGGGVAAARAAKLSYHNAGQDPGVERSRRTCGCSACSATSPRWCPADPKSVLVIGCGAGVTAGAVSIDPRVERVTIAEIEPLVPRVVSTYFGAQNYDVVHNPKVHVRIDDARHYLLTTKEKFDAITSDPLDPWVKGAATLYTREFFELAKQHLNPGGMVTLFVQLYESSPDAVKSEIGDVLRGVSERHHLGQYASGQGIRHGAARAGRADATSTWTRCRRG